MTSLVNSSGFFPSSIKLKAKVKYQLLENNEKPELGHKRIIQVEVAVMEKKNSLKNLHRNLNAALLS
jgi:hypothetical protein